ncbi:MAG: TDT family transporter [Defluviitaleaceae bacterium]|nr:TDT family transporter [Defluviitaleaceae bacterium]
MKQLIDKTANLPVGAIATAVGLATLSNLYFAIGFPAVRLVTMVCVALVWVAAFLKLTVHFKTFFVVDYINTVPASLYATFTMLTMILGNFVFLFNESIGFAIWISGVGLHVIHILVFTYLHAIKNFNIETFVPSWFVTYMGFLVSTVVGAEKGAPTIFTAIVYYGFAMYVIIFPAMVIRLIKKPLPDQFKLTAGILLAPSSLLFVSYLNFTDEPIAGIVFALYSIIFLTLLYIAYKLPQFLRIKFNPGFAALTFPTAIALVATFRMGDFLLNTGHYQLGTFVNHFFGIQLYITTAVIAFVAYGFLKMLSDSFEKKGA